MSTWNGSSCSCACLPPFQAPVQKVTSRKTHAQPQPQPQPQPWPQPRSRSFAHSPTYFDRSYASIRSGWAAEMEFRCVRGHFITC